MSMSNRCRVCSEDMEPDKLMCTHCGNWNPLGGANDMTPEQVKGIPLSDVVSADLNRMSTGPWDECFGETIGDDGKVKSRGLVRTSAVLLGGSPGAGKSTVTLQLCRNVVVQPELGKAIYLAAEEALPEVKLRGDRLGFTPQEMKRIIMIPAMSGANLETVVNAQDEPPGICIIDSLQGMVGDDNDMQAKVCSVGKEYAVKHQFPVIIISHVTKGDEIAGLLKLQHKVDTTMTFFPDEETGDFENEPLRIMRVLKNRFGRAFIERAFNMTRKGLTEASYPENEDEDEDED